MPLCLRCVLSVLLVGVVCVLGLLVWVRLGVRGVLSRVLRVLCVLFVLLRVLLRVVRVLCVLWVLLRVLLRVLRVVRRVLPVVRLAFSAVEAASAALVYLFCLPPLAFGLT